jgi:hypothetical protein
MIIRAVQVPGAKVDFDVKRTIARDGTERVTVTRYGPAEVCDEELDRSWVAIRLAWPTIDVTDTAIKFFIPPYQHVPDSGLK